MQPRIVASSVQRLMAVLVFEQSRSLRWRLITKISMHLNKNNVKNIAYLFDFGCCLVAGRMLAVVPEKLAPLVRHARSLTVQGVVAQIVPLQS